MSVRTMKVTIIHQICTWLLSMTICATLLLFKVKSKDLFAEQIMSKGLKQIHCHCNKLL